MPTHEGWLYLADVLDLGSRRVVGFAMEDHMRTALVAKALDMAIATRGHSSLGNVPPLEWELRYVHRQFLAA